jgi:DUF1680 family protein
MDVSSSKISPRDSDVAKWLEAACYTLIYEPDPSLATLVEEAVDLIRGAQQEDGYINTYYTVRTWNWPTSYPILRLCIGG